MINNNVRVTFGRSEKRRVKLASAVNPILTEEARVDRFSALS